MAKILPDALPSFLQGGKMAVIFAPTPPKPSQQGKGSESLEADVAAGATTDKGERCPPKRPVSHSADDCDHDVATTKAEKGIGGGP